MALIECKSCGKQISDKAKICPNCGEVLIADSIPNPLKCPECGCEIPTDSDSCPNCGCPIEKSEETVSPQKVEVTRVSFHVDKKKVLKIIIIAIAAIAVIAAIFYGVSANKEKKAQEAAAKALSSYSDNFDLCVSTMYLGAVQAEKTGGLIHDVWYNTIYEERDTNTDKFTRSNGYFNDDFNDSLSNLFGDSSFQSDISNIKTNQDLVASLMKDLKNPPDEYKDAYDALKDLYEVYTDLTQCAVDPSGNLSSYTSSFNTADSDFVKYYKAVKLYQ